MAEIELVMLDGVKWWVTKDTAGSRIVIPICIKHNLRLTGLETMDTNRLTGQMYKVPVYRTKSLMCQDEGGHIIGIPKPLDEEQQYVLNKIDAPIFAQMKVLNLDDMAIPVATEELKDTNYWVKAKVTKSKSGTRLIVWAGDKSKKNKTQLFVEPTIKRLSFDQNDDHPSEIFTKVEATFAEGVISTIEAMKKGSKKK